MVSEFSNHVQGVPLIAFVFFFQVDPTRTISAGKVNLGAFRTYPKVILGKMIFHF